ncbi:hypothetical protein SLEP1_g38723 [Rubroshorea leprosula]|uniref:Uncharacterized protein n=1 Tax=Rubroshorea leprosula TaxID=152421 RepID=A0AAV5KYP5_9ROSI|nr:hypothetical protein SLEP1_g38723 [Rubroshorea leprosula]
MMTSLISLSNPFTLMTNRGICLREEFPPLVIDFF